MSLRQCYQHIVVKTSQFLLALWQIGVCNKDFFVLFDFFSYPCNVVFVGNIDP
jgi:hypothetical protein